MAIEYGPLDPSDNGVVTKQLTALPSETRPLGVEPTGQLVTLESSGDNSTITAHIANTNNPHSTTKAQVGLGNVDNTSDANKPISSATQTALDAKANASALTAHTGDTNNPHAVTKSQVGLGNVDNTADASKPISTATQTALASKADLVAGKHTAAQSRSSSLSYNASNGTITLTGADGSTSTIDTPIELLMQSASYDSGTKTVTFTLNGGGTVSVPLTDLVDLPEVQLGSADPTGSPTTGIRLYYRTDNGNYWIANAGAWVGPFLNITASERSKLSGIASGATANATDAQLRDRSTHTGTQTAATISDFNSAAVAATSSSYQPIGSNNIFSTVQPQNNGTNGTAVVADSSTDTLTINARIGCSIGGDAASDTLTLSAFGFGSCPPAQIASSYRTQQMPSGSGQLALVANRLYKLPIVISERITIASVIIGVTALSAGSSIRIGIRRFDHTTGEFTTLPSGGDFGTVSGATTGTRIITGLSCVVEPGVYAIEIVSDGTPTVSGTSSNIAQPSIWGAVWSSNFAFPTFAAQRTFTFGALPTNESGVSQTAISSGVIPVVGLGV